MATAAALALASPWALLAANNGAEPMHQNPAGISINTGDFVSHPTGLDTYYSYFIEVPPATANLTVDVFDADTGDGANPLDRLSGANNTSALYELFDPSGASQATLTCAPGTCVARDGVFSNLAAIANPAAGHWELRIDMSNTVTTGNDSNGYALRAHDGDTTAGGTELNVYALSYVPPAARGVSEGTPITTTLYPYVTAGCTFDNNEFDWDINLPNVDGEIAYTSPSTAFAQSFTGAQLSGNSAWSSNAVGPWTTDTRVEDYGLWSGAYTLEGTATNNNYSVVYLGDDNAAAPPPTAQPEANSFRIYLPTDGGTAPVKPIVRQRSAAISGPNPPAVGMTTQVEVAIEVENPTPFPIAFSAMNQLTANVPGGGVVYVGSSASASQGTVTGEPAGGGTGDVTWNPGTLASGATAVLTYRVDVTPPGAARLPVTGTPAMNGTTAVYLDETGDQTHTFGPLCELAVTPGMALPAPPLGIAKAMSATGTNPYTVTIDYVVENFGPDTISNLSATDDLVAVFGATPGDWTFTSISKISGPATFNPDLSFTGQGANTELIAAGSSLGVGESGQIQVVISVTTPGTYVNQVSVTGETAGGDLVGDDSVDGADPDPNGDGNPGEEGPSTVTIETPVVGAAKAMSASGAGPFTVTIDHVFENLGDVPLTNLTATDDLVAVFGAAPANWTFTSISKTSGPASFNPDAAYTGQGANTELIAAGSSLLPGEIGEIQVVISVTTPGTYNNQVTVTGDAPSGAMVSDTSTDGADPDPNGDGDPSEMTPSTVDLVEDAEIGAAKAMSATGTGPFTVTIDYAFENLGMSELTNLTAMDDLVAVFGATPANWTFTSISKTSGPASFNPDPAYDGQGANTELIAAGSSLLPGEIGEIQVVISVTTTGTFNNQVTVTGDAPSGGMVSDVSTDGADPDPNGDGDPSEMTPSTVTLTAGPEAIGAAKVMSASGTGPFTLTIDYAFENFGTSTLSNLTATDDLEAVFGTPGVDWTFLSIAKASGPAAFDVNAAFTGEAPMTELIAMGSSLDPGEVGEIEVTIEVATPGTYVNQVTVTGDTPLGAMVSDTSTDGTDPDPGGDGTPDEGVPSTIVLALALPIPTLGEWALLVLAALLGLAGLAILRRG